MKISRRGVDTGTDGSAAEVYCIHFSAHVSEAQDVSFDYGSVIRGRSGRDAWERHPAAVYDPF